MGENPFECSEGEKAFGYHISLNQQPSTQPGEKPCAYNLCGKAIWNCLNHITPKRSYTEEKCSECKEGGKLFSNPPSLTIPVLSSCCWETLQNFIYLFLHGWNKPYRPFKKLRAQSGQGGRRGQEVPLLQSQSLWRPPALWWWQARHPRVGLVWGSSLWTGRSCWHWCGPTEWAEQAVSQQGIPAQLSSRVASLASLSLDPRQGSDLISQIEKITLKIGVVSTRKALEMWSNTTYRHRVFLKRISEAFSHSFEIFLIYLLRGG